MDEDEPPLVLASAAKHGVNEADAIHAWAFAVRAFRLEADLVMYIGPATSGQLLEVGVVAWHGVLAIVHAMPARERFLR